MMRTVIFLISVMMPFFIWGQEVEIDLTTNNTTNIYEFKADTINAPLTRSSGGRIPFYTHWWEFGDGHMTTKSGINANPNPQYQYSTSKDVDSYLFSTNRYDNGDKPPKGKRLIQPTISNRIIPSPTYFPQNHVPNVYMEASSNARRNEEIAFRISYKDPSDFSIRTNEGEPLRGQIALFFNEKSFNKTLFEEQQVRMHYDEQVRYLDATYLGFEEDTIKNTAFDGVITDDLAGITSDMQQKITINEDIYQDKIVWQFDTLAPNTERNIFISLYGTNDMVQYQDQEVKMLLVYSDNYNNTDEYEFKFSIVAAHDPNIISVSEVERPYNSPRRTDDLIYRIDFQNEGRGATDTVGIDVFTDQYLDNYTIQILETKPECLSVSTNCFNFQSRANKIELAFSNITLAGLQESSLVDEAATKGFVRFKITPKATIQNQPIETYAEITFRGQNPIRTNTAITRFKDEDKTNRCCSMGIKGGYSFNSKPQIPYAFGGVTYSLPCFKQCYYQAELMFGTAKSGDERYHYFDLVPLQIRKKILPFAEISIGGQVSFSLLQLDKITSQPTLYSAFGDISFGKIPTGASVGLRYHYVLNKDDTAAPYFRTYAQWKF